MPSISDPSYSKGGSDIHWIKFNIYIVDNTICCHDTYLLDSDLFGG